MNGSHDDAHATWVLLRGLTREQRHWGPFPAWLGAALPGARIVTLDLPGNGDQQASISPITVSDMVDCCRAELVRRGVPPPYKLLAMSLGAMVATDWAHRFAEDVSGCVLINTSMRPFSPFYQRLKPCNYPALLKLALIGGTPRQWEETVLRITTHHPANPESTVNEWIEFREQSPVTSRNALRQLMAAARYTAPSTQPATRLLILTSDADGLVDTRCSAQLAAAWGVNWVAHPTAGHDLPLDDGPWVVAQIRRWDESPQACR